MRTTIVLWMFLAYLALATCSALAAEGPVGPYLQGLSVNVACPAKYGGSTSAEGSGTVIVTPLDDHKACWILTAHHVAEGLREVTTVINADGEEKKQVSYRDAKIVQEQVEGGRAVGEVKFDAEVISVDERRDIALLRVRSDTFADEGVVFYLEDDIPPPGTAVFHVGAPGGKDLGGTCSLTSGIISRIGVRIPEFGGSEHGIFDQTDVAALGGSSGGMLALRKDGRWVGMITLGLEGSDSFHWVVPVRSVRDWAEEIGIPWLLDPKADPPTREDLERIPLENNPAGYAGKAAEDGAGTAGDEPEERVSPDIVRRGK